MGDAISGKCHVREMPYQGDAMLGFFPNVPLLPNAALSKCAHQVVDFGREAVGDHGGEQPDPYAVGAEAAMERHVLLEVSGSTLHLVALTIIALPNTVRTSRAATD